MPRRFYGMSAQIGEEGGDYYGILERTQRSTMDVTEWFLGCLTRDWRSSGYPPDVIAKAR